MIAFGRGLAAGARRLFGPRYAFAFFAPAALVLVLAAAVPAIGDPA